MYVRVRELQSDLSRHLAEVMAGHIVTVTDQGRPIARIVPVDCPTKYEQLVAEGRITRARRPKGPPPTPVHAGATVSDLIYDERRGGGGT